MRKLIILTLLVIGGIGGLSALFLSKASPDSAPKDIKVIELEDNFEK